MWLVSPENIKNKIRCRVVVVEGSHASDRDKCFILLGETLQLVHFQPFWREFRKRDPGLVLLIVWASGSLAFLP